MTAADGLVHAVEDVSLDAGRGKLRKAPITTQTGAIRPFHLERALGRAWPPRPLA